MIILTAITAVAAMVSAIISLFETIHSRRINASIQEETTKHRTIIAYAKLQKDVLDKLVSFKKNEIKRLVQTIDDIELGNDEKQDFIKAYDDYRALIAKCEHFAVGVNEKIYDINVVNKLGGIHLIALYETLKPVIDRARENGRTNIPYKYFEMLVDELKTKY